MTTVFLSGSRMVSRLDEEVCDRIDKIVENGLSVVTGDANGADKAMQTYLANYDYRDVTVHFVGETPRNNVGHWKTAHVETSGKQSGREYYAQKDHFMAQIADCGLVLWDGKSAGSVQNMFWLSELGKPTVVFHNGLKRFFNLRGIGDIAGLLAYVKPADLKDLDRKIRVSSMMQTDEQAFLEF